MKILSFIYIFLFSSIVALVCYFCNSMCLIHNFLSVTEPANPIQTLGDRGGTHISDFGLSLTSSTALIIALCIVIALCIIGIVSLILLKRKNMLNVIEENKQKELEKEKNKGKKKTKKKFDEFKEIDNSK